MYCVVEFKEDKSVTFVPQSWVFGKERYVYWPPFSNKSAQLNDAIKSKQEPQIDWGKWRVKVWTKNIFSTKEAKLERDKIISQVTATSSSSAESEQSSPSPRLSEPDKTIVAESHIIENADIESIKKDIVQIKRDITKMKFTLDDIKHIMTQMVENKSVSPNLPIRIPINGIEHLLEIENELKQENNKQATISYLIKIGGRNVQDCTYRVMARLFDIKFCVELNWAGRFGKTGLRVKCPTLVDIIVEAVKSFCNATEKEVENKIKDFLRTAKDRAGLRKSAVENIGETQLKNNKSGKDNDANFNDDPNSLEFEMDDN